VQVPGSSDRLLTRWVFMMTKIETPRLARSGGERLNEMVPTLRAVEGCTSRGFDSPVESRHRMTLGLRARAQGKGTL